jgi:hypothetical protein
VVGGFICCQERQRGHKQPPTRQPTTSNPVIRCLFPTIRHIVRHIVHASLHAFYELSPTSKPELSLLEASTPFGWTLPQAAMPGCPAPVGHVQPYRGACFFKLPASCLTPGWLVKRRPGCAAPARGRPRLRTSILILYASPSNSYIIVLRVDTCMYIMYQQLYSRCVFLTCTVYTFTRVQ